MKKNYLIFIIALLLNTLFNSGIYAQVPQIMWWFDTNDSSFGMSALDDIDNDGKPEIVFGCYRNDSSVYALNAENGSLLWKYNTSIGLDGCNDVAPVIYDVDGDRTMEVFVPASCTPRTYCFNGLTGNPLWQASTRGSDSPPVVVDLNNDGRMEIMHGQFGGYVINLDAQTGSINWEILVDSDSWVQTAPTIVDLDGNDTLDFVVATWGFNDNSAFYAYNGSNQQLMWTVPMNDYVYHGSAVADLDNDGKPELVVGDYSGRLHVLNAENGTYYWDYYGTGYIGAPAAIADINGDGQCDVVLCSGSQVVALNKAGTLIWQYQIPNYGQAFRGVALADITDDGIPEIIFGTSTGKVYALKGVNGSLLWDIDLKAHIGKPFEIDHAPVIADFDGNDTLDLFIVGGHTDYPNFQDNYGRGYAIKVGKGKGPDWKMFQRDYYRTSSHCYPGIIHDAVINQMQEDDIILYPNPADSFVLIKGNYHNNIISIYNAQGQLVYQHLMQYNGSKIGLEHLSNGIYFYKINDKLGNNIKTGKLVKSSLN